MTLLSKQVPIRFLCRHFKVAASSYYYWINKSSKISDRRLNLEKQIKSSFNESKGVYGAPRVVEDLKDKDIMISKNTVAKYMKDMGLRATLKKKFKVLTTDSNHESPIAKRVFKTEDIDLTSLKPNELLAGDITYLRLGSGFVYLAVVLDIKTRQVVGWSMGKSMQTSLVLNALDYAMKNVGPSAEVVFHSDRGTQYASEAYRSFLKQKKITQSMSRKGNCYDNAYVE